jgi:hypothetical protein
MMVIAWRCASVAILPTVKAQHQFRHGNRRVAPVAARHPAAMGVFADAACSGHAQIAADAGDDADRNLLVFQYRSLLDVQFQVGCER